LFGLWRHDAAFLECGGKTPLCLAGEYYMPDCERERVGGKQSEILLSHSKN
jgi:hypothetical protein